MKQNFGLKIFTVIVIAAVVVAVGAGLYLVGGPGKERQKRFDSERISALQQISYAVDSYFERNGTLPNSLEMLAASGAVEPLTKPDPETGAPYEYRVTGAVTYELCTTFDLPSSAGDVPATPRPIKPYPALTAENWDHPAGHHCFSLNAETQTAKPPCGLQNPCAAGQSCAVLPNRTAAVCVPAGKECDAAGCPGACTLAESYPVQVRCAPDHTATH